MRRLSPALILVAAALAACDPAPNKNTGVVVPPGEKTEGQSEFETPTQGGGGRYNAGAPGGAESDAGNRAPSDGAAGGGQNTPPPERLVEESDIYKLVGNTLYVLNHYRGLQVIDISNLDNPRLVGRAPIFGYPKEMYVRGNRAYVIVSDYYRFWREEVATADGAPKRFYGSQVRIIDIADPAAPAVVGGIDVEGDVSDSRIVGDMLYVVSQRWGWWYRYDSDDNVNKTVISSIDIADEANVRFVDSLDFPQNGWEHHITTASDPARDRYVVYVAASGWDQGWQDYQTRIRYVDISDRGGAIRARGEAHIPGRVMDRWSMDEYQGVLRVASGKSWGNGDVYLSTVDVANPDSLQPLGKYTLRVNERLTSARFDGTHGYLVTYRNIDPLFTFDLSVPAQPQLMGELEMTGWLDFMVPLGDRIVALGHEDVTDANGSRKISLAVSLIGIPQGKAAPTLLSRVVLGGNWGWVPGDRDDFAKVFKVLPGTGLVMFPFQAWSETDWRYVGGVQLIDYSRDALVGRGLIRDAGWVQRAVPHGDTTVLTVSDEVFQIMDIADRDNPRVRGRLELARNVQDFSLLPGGYAVELNGDWYRGDADLTVVRKSDPDAATPVAKLHLPAPYGRLFVNGSFAYVLSMRDFGQGSTTHLQVVDLSDPANPRLRGSTTLPEPVYPGYRSWYWGYGDETVQVNGSLLALHRYNYGWYYEDCINCGAREENAHKIFLLDASDPDAPRLASTVKIDSANWAWGLKVRGNALYMSEYRTLQRSDRWVNRYYLRRIDVSNPAAPVVEEPINIPGTLVGFSPDGYYIHTLESWWDDTYSRSTTKLHTLLLAGQRAYLRGSVEIPGWISNVHVEGQHAYLSTSWGENVASGASQRWVNHVQLKTLSLADPRNPVVAGSLDLPVDYAWLQKVAGGRAFMGSYAGILSFVVGDPAHPTFETFFRTQGWANDLILDGSKLFVPAGYYGVQMFDLPAGSH